MNACVDKVSALAFSNGQSPVFAEKVAASCRTTTNKERPDAYRFYESLGFVPSHTGFKLDLTKPR